MNSKLQVNNEFDKHVKFLMDIYVNKKKGTFDESDAVLAKRRLILIMKTNPFYVIKTIGPYFLKYGEYIQDGRFNELLGKSFDDETKNSKDKEHIKQTMSFVKNIYKSAREDEKNKLNTIFENMLSLYAEFVLISKKNT